MPTSQPNRLLEPDFARGFALLGIAIANATTIWALVATMGDNAVPTSIGLIVDNSLGDKIAIFIGAVFVHVRGLPMFATLFGYGIGMIYLREWRKGATFQQNRSVLLRRYGFLALFGIVHLLFLYWGDIMFYYGAIALLIIPMAKLPDKTLAIIAASIFAIGLVAAFLTLYFFPELTSQFAGGSGSYVKDQLMMGGLILLVLPFQLAFAGLLVIPLIIVGFIAGRREVFHKPEQYHKQLRIAVAITIGVILLVGIPYGLSAIGVVGDPVLLRALNGSLGMSTGPGLVVLLFWLARALNRRGLATTVPVRMVVALGRMSMTGYVLQSVLFGIFVASYGLGLVAGAGALAVSLAAVAVWFATVLFTFAWSSFSKTGPLEWVHRRLAYKKKPVVQVKPLVETTAAENT